MQNRAVFHLIPKHLLNTLSNARYNFSKKQMVLDGEFKDAKPSSFSI